MKNVQDTVTSYLGEPGPHCLEIGTGLNPKKGWLCTDLEPIEPDGGQPASVFFMDATQPFPLPSASFDAVYTEHTIEHLALHEGMHLVSEAFRILREGGLFRVVTPSLGFLLRMASIDKDHIENRYLTWAMNHSLPNAPMHSVAVFVNNFVRAWGHTFIYDRPTLRMTIEGAGFTQVRECSLDESSSPHMTSIANTSRMPPGFLELESMVMEGRKP